MHKRCLYCDAPADSKEHIVQSAIGGRLELKGVFCRPHNREAGNAVDEHLTEAFQLFTTYLNVSSDHRRGEGGPTIKNVKGTDGKTYDFHGGGQPEVSKGKLAKLPLGPNGEVHVQIGARSVEEAKYLEGCIRKKYPKLRAVPDGATLTSYYPTLGFNLSIGGPEQFRAITKMCLALAAAKTELVEVHRALFQPIIDFVRHGTGKNPTNHDYVNAFPTPTSRVSGDFLHSVTVCGERGRTLAGFVRIYGHFQFSVLLANESPERLALHYVVDPLTGEHEQVADFAFDPQTPANVERHVYDKDEVHGVFRTAFAKVMQRGDHAKLKAVLEERCAALEANGVPFTEENVATLVEDVYAEMSAYFNRAERKIDVTDQFRSPSTPPL